MNDRTYCKVITVTVALCAKFSEMVITHENGPVVIRFFFFNYLQMRREKNLQHHKRTAIITTKFILKKK